MPEEQALAWYEHGYAVPVGAALAMSGVVLFAWVLRRWPGALWRRLRGRAYVPGELLWASLGGVVSVLVILLGAGMVAVERGLGDFQSFEEAKLAGYLHVEQTPSAIRTAWREPSGSWTLSVATRCPRLELRGEFIIWHRAAGALGFRNRHRVAGGAPVCPGGEPDAAAAVRFRPPSATWEAMRRWDRWIPGLEAERRSSPPLRVSNGSWRVFVTQGGYAFAE